MKFILLLSIIFISIPSLVQAQCGSCNQAASGITWEGDVSSDWNDPNNWASNALPVANNDIIIDGNSYTNAPIISINSTFSPADIFIQNNATLTVQADLSINDDFFIRDASFLIIEGGSNANGDDINLCKGGTINMTGGFLDNTSGSGLMRICTTQPAAAAAVVGTKINISGGSIVSTDSEVSGGNPISSHINTTGAGSYSDNNGTLPVDLISFTGTYADSKTTLHWVTAAEVNNSHFEIQSSENKTDFETIGSLSGHGTTSEIHEYQFVITQAQPNRYYRLKQFDYDGKSEFFGPIAIGRTLLDHQFEVRKTANQTLEIEVANSPNTYSIYNLAGHVVFEQKGGQNTTISTRTLPVGIYVIKLQWADQIKTRKIQLN